MAPSTSYDSSSTQAKLAVLIKGAPRDYFNTEPAVMASMLALYRYAHCANEERKEFETLCERSLEQWQQVGLPVATKNGKKFFDPATTLNFMKLRGLRGEDSFWRDCVVHSARRHITDLRALEDGAEVRVAVRTAFFEAHERPKRRSLALPFSTPLAMIRELTTVPETAKRSGDTLSIRRQQSPILLGYDVEASAHSVAVYGPSKLDTEEQEVYLRCEEGLIHVTPRTREFSSKETRGIEKSRRVEIIRQLRHALFKNGVLGVVHYDRIQTPDLTQWFLATGVFDCFMGASLLVSWARSLGIPARITGGLSLYPKAPSSHFWAEFHLDGEGWFPVDVATWDISLAGEDEDWTDTFFGELDPRLVTHSLPLRFPGISALPTGSRYTRVAQARDDGCVTQLIAVGGDMATLSEEFSRVQFDQHTSLAPRTQV